MSGGWRPGAGHPVGSGKYGEPTEPIRVPTSMLKEVVTLVKQGGRKLPLYRASPDGEAVCKFVEISQDSCADSGKSGT